MSPGGAGLAPPGDIVVEQHPDRARLFMQWQEMDWPVMVDPFNLLGLSAVPMTICVDENGVIRLLNPDPGDLERFRTAFLESEPAESPSQAHDPTEAVQPGALRHAVDLALWGGESRLDEAVMIAREAVASDGSDLARFALGVVYRMRFDSARRRPGDFDQAVRHWQMALDLDPNNYIWRRRLQQYGPRPSKPYAFYDWVPVARGDLAARGQIPLPLVAEPTRSELAEPLEVAPPAASDEEPDPDDRIERDDGLVDVETTVVPPLVSPGDSVRVHLELTPDLKRDAHWNNEADPLELWFNAPPGWAIEWSSYVVPNARGEVSSETKRVDFELRTPVDQKPAEVSVDGYALFYICEGRHGVCSYRRHDVAFSVDVSLGDPLADAP
jgi:hypothetical protein